MAQQSILVTGAAGFIGFHLSRRLAEDGYKVTGIDNLSPYYEVSLKEARLRILKSLPGFEFQQLDLNERDKVPAIFKEGRFSYVVHLAAQAGVRYSLENPHAYIDSNIAGFLNILEACRNFKPGHLVFASSSSVYGANTKMPFSVHDNVDHPVSLYAASKKSNELMAHAYSALHGIPSTGLRFFTVYGPWGRPDMALFIFVRSILEGTPIALYNHGEMKRDFTYVDDIVEGLIRLIPNPPKPNPSWNPSQPDPASSFTPYRLYNIGNNQPVELRTFVRIIEEKLGRKAIIDSQPMQKGDVVSTFADIDDLQRDTGFKPSTPIETGIGKFVDWYLEYYKIKK